MQVSAVDRVGKQRLYIGLVVVHSSQLEEIGKEGPGKGKGIAEVLEQIVIIRSVVKDGRVLYNQLSEEGIRGAGFVVGQRFQDGVLEGAGVPHFFINALQSGYDGLDSSGIIDKAEFVDKLRFCFEVVFSIVRKGIDSRQQGGETGCAEVDVGDGSFGMFGDQGIRAVKVAEKQVELGSKDRGTCRAGAEGAGRMDERPESRIEAVDEVAAGLQGVAKGNDPEQEVVLEEDTHADVAKSIGV